MSDAVLVSVIIVVGLAVTVLGWKLLDIGKRAMELDRGRHSASDDREVGP